MINMLLACLCNYPRALSTCPYDLLSVRLMVRFSGLLWMCNPWQLLGAPLATGFSRPMSIPMGSRQARDSNIPIYRRGTGSNTANPTDNISRSPTTPQPRMNPCPLPRSHLIVERRDLDSFELVDKPRPLIVSGSPGLISQI